MKSVWVIEKGEYSDYRVLGVYSTEEKARTVADAINKGLSEWDDPAEVDEWELDRAVEAARDGWDVYWVVMDSDGTVEQLEAKGPLTAYALMSGLGVWSRTTTPAYARKGVPDAVAGHVIARDEKHAIKIANEKRVQRLASGELKRAGEDPDQ